MGSLSPRAPAPKWPEGRGRPTSPPPLRRSASSRQRGTRPLRLLAIFVTVIGVAQLWGVGPSLRRTLLARCPTHNDAGHGYTAVPSSHGGLWEQLCAHEARWLAAISAARTGSDGGTRSGGDGAGGTVDYGGAAAAALAADDTHGAWPDVYGGQAEPHKKILRRCTGSLFAPPLGPGARPAEGLVGVWMPQQFDLLFCDSAGRSVLLALRPAASGPAPSTAAAAAAARGGSGGAESRSGAVAGVGDGGGAGSGAEARPVGALSGASGASALRGLKEAVASAGGGGGGGVVGGGWAEAGVGEDVAGGGLRTGSGGGRGLGRWARALLSTLPLTSSAFHRSRDTLSAGRRASDTGSGGASSSSGGLSSAEAQHGSHRLARQRTDRRKSSVAVSRQRHGEPGGADDHANERLLAVAKELGGPGRSIGNVSRTAGTSASAGSGGDLNGARALAESSGPGSPAVDAAADADAASLPIELATSRALVADGGSIRIAWADASTLLAEGVTAQLEGGAPCPGVAGALCACAGACSGLTGRPHAATRVSPSRGGGRGLGLGAAGAHANARTAGGGDAAAGAAESLAEEQWPAPAEVLVLAAEGPRAVVSLVGRGSDVVAAARAAVGLLRASELGSSTGAPNVTGAGPGFSGQLRAAVSAAYAALRGVPRAIGLPHSAPAEDRRLARKLYDIMSLNTGVGWSTPDRTPHAWQWLWDSCFHAMGMNLVDHTTAWEQLRGLLRCQHDDGFIPHMCGGGPPSRLTQPPLLAWAVWDNFLFSRDRSRLEWALPRLIRFLDWLARHRSRDGGLTYFYVHGFESGMDNSPRFDGAGLGGWLGSLARRWTGDPGAGACHLCAPHLLSADLCALAAREMGHVARMLRELGRAEEAEYWLARSRAVAAALTRAAWSPERRIYGDVVRGGGPLGLGLGLGLLGGKGQGERQGERQGRVSEVVTVAGLVPLLAGRLPRDQLAGLLAHLKDPDSFATEVPLPSVAVSSQRRPAAAAAKAPADGSSYAPHLDMWRGPMWVNMNLMVAVGLREQRCAECDLLALRLLNSTIATVRRWYGQDYDSSNKSSSRGAGAGAGPVAAGTGTVFEYYDSDGRLPPTRLARKKVAGVGGVRDYHWTAALTLRMMAEVSALSARSMPHGAAALPLRVMGAAVEGAAFGVENSTGRMDGQGEGSGGGGGAGLAELDEGEFDGLPEWVPGRPLWPRAP